MKRILLTLAIYLWGMAMMVSAQRACLSKLSPMLRHYVLEQRVATDASVRSSARRIASLSSQVSTMAFVKIDGDGQKTLREQQCKVWARWGNVYIATVPMNRIAKLSLLPEVQRIEANRGNSCTMDSAIIQVHAQPVYDGIGLPQTFTGKGVVMGIMDIGFDLTHPNFYSYDMKKYRIKAFWDQISSDTLQSTLPVGRDYTTQESLLAIGNSLDGKDQNHGTHTLGIAAGSGCEGVALTSPGTYHGLAFDSDICLVTNATSENQGLIDESQRYKFTYAMDALGFKYIFDYADKVGKPCVISFSEGASQGFGGEDVLYSEVLDSLISVPGHVIVSSAGNNGMKPYYIHKPVGQACAGCYVKNDRSYVYHVAKSKGDFTLRTTFQSTSGEILRTVEVKTQDVFDASVDSTYVLPLTVGEKEYTLTIGAYPSCYNKEDICYDWIMEAQDGSAVGNGPYISYEVVGDDADVEVFHGAGDMYKNSLRPSLFDADNTHGINAPSCTESVICVGSTINRSSTENLDGKKVVLEKLPVGAMSAYSSIGPTFDERVKPDVVAPGTHVISSNSSCYLTAHPEHSYYESRRFMYDGKTYGWFSNSGTSMASPIVGGAIALWMEANPSLTRKDVMRIIAKTSVPLESSMAVPNNKWGYGLIDVYGGLLAALHLDGIHEISQHQPRKAHVGIDSEGCVVVSLDDDLQDDLTVNIYSVGGVKLKSERMNRGQKDYRMDISSLDRGVYVVQLVGNKNLTGSSLVRR